LATTHHKRVGWRAPRGWMPASAAAMRKRGARTSRDSFGTGNQARWAEALKGIDLEALRRLACRATQCNETNLSPSSGDDLDLERHLTCEPRLPRPRFQVAVTSPQLVEQVGKDRPWPLRSLTGQGLVDRQAPWYAHRCVHGLTSRRDTGQPLVCLFASEASWSSWKSRRELLTAIPIAALSAVRAPVSSRPQSQRPTTGWSRRRSRGFHIWPEGTDVSEESDETEQALQIVMREEFGSRFARALRGLFVLGLVVALALLAWWGWRS
jgi:hypothetical protein